MAPKLILDKKEGSEGAFGCNADPSPSSLDNPLANSHVGEGSREDERARKSRGLLQILLDQ